MRAGFAAPSSEFNKDRNVQPVLGLPQIRGEPWHQGAGRTANIIAENRGRAGGWRDTTWPREIRHVRGPMVVLPTERNILAGHPVKSPRYIPSLVRIARVLGEIGRARSRRRTVDRRQQNQIPPGIVDLPASECQAILVVIEPQAIVEHVSQEALLGPLRGVASAADAAAVLASHVAGEREGRLIKEPLLVVVIFNLDAVVRVIADTARRIQRILTQGVLIPENRQPAIRPP